LNILYTIRRANQLYGDHHAIVHESGNVTYREFYRNAKRAAGFLRQYAQPGEHVAVLMLNRPEYFELYYATAIAGVVIVPLNTRWGLHDFVFALNDSGSKVLIVDERFVPLVPQLREQCPEIETVIFAGAGDVPAGMLDYHVGVAAAAELDSVREPEPNDLAGLFYTSGTTGGPKAAMLTHANLYSNAVTVLLSGMPPSSVYLHAAPMFHLADIGSLYLSVLRGTSHAFIQTFDPEECMKAIERHRVSSLTLVPTMINLIVNHPKFASYDLSSLGTILYGASPMPLPLLKRLMVLLPQCRFWQGYGMTEMSPVITVLNPDDHLRQWPEGKFNPLASGGRPAPGVEVRIVDDLDNDVPVGTPGEIIARGAARMPGYWKRDDVNRDVLRGGWMHTGDMGCFDERGFVYVMDRKKDMIKTGGENVYSPEVEAVVAAHPAVLEVAVIGVPDEKWGESIRAIIARRPDSTVTAGDIIGFCRERLTHFKCPTSVRFVEALPKGGTGKVQKNVLRRDFSTSN
jgi:long-chain acyl-CoA synthetase